MAIDLKLIDKLLRFFADSAAKNGPFGAAWLKQHCYPAGHVDRRVERTICGSAGRQLQLRGSRRFECLLHAVLFGGWVPHVVAQTP
jgi:hypothetical protein